MGTIWNTQGVKKISLHDADFGAVVLKSKKQWLHDCWRLVDTVNGGWQTVVGTYLLVRLGSNHWWLAEWLAEWLDGSSVASVAATKAWHQPDLVGDIRTGASTLVSPRCTFSNTWVGLGFWARALSVLLSARL